MKKFEVIEDNGGGLALVVFGDSGNVEYVHSNYEYNAGQLLEDIVALKQGGDPVKEWDGNEDDSQGWYDNITSFEYGWEVVANNEGIYPEKMGFAAMREFGIGREFK